MKRLPPLLAIDYAFFFLSRFSFTDIDNSHDSREREGTIFLFHSTTSTHSQTFRHLCATLHVRWLSHIFDRNACIYQTATRWGLPPYQITIWLIDDVMLIFVCLVVDLILGFITTIWHERNRWTWTRIEYHPCITSEPTKLLMKCLHSKFSNFWPFSTLRVFEEKTTKIVNVHQYFVAFYLIYNILYTGLLNGPFCEFGHFIFLFC